jgi:hypothetical protein
VSDDLAVSQFETRPVDPRDAAWELSHPAYRVLFWRQLGDGAWASREFEVTTTDVRAVLRWADGERVGDEDYQVFAVVLRDSVVGMVRLVGDDPTRT